MSSLVPTLDPIEYASREALEALQLERLKWTLHHAWENVPMYRKKFTAAGVHPGDLRQLSDIVKFPFTSKQDLRDNYPFATFAVPSEQIVRLHASSGTTGKPTVVGYTAADLARWTGLVARCLRSVGVTSRDKVHIAYGYGLFTGGMGAHYGAEKLGATVIPASTGQTEKQAQLILDLQPDVIMATPSYCLALTDELERRMGGDARGCSLRLGVLGAEPWSAALRGEIESRLGITACNIYGLSEVMGPGVAIECDGPDAGSTIWEDHFYPEVIDPLTLELLPAGIRGELVFTSLSKEAMPVIRYRSHDMSSLLPGGRRPMRRMAAISGRSDDMLIVRGINIFPSQLEEQIMRCPGLSSHYLLEVSRSGNLDHLALRVERKTTLDASRSDETAKQLQHHIKSLIGISAQVSVVEPGTLPRSEGKAVRVVDSRGTQDAVPH